jgi:hypothetical protein
VADDFTQFEFGNIARRKQSSSAADQAQGEGEASHESLPINT